MMSEDIKARVLTMLREVLDDNKEQLDTIGSNEDLSVLGINSITFIRIVLALEMEFGVSWDDDDLEYQNFLTIENIVNYITDSMARSA